MVRVLIGVFFSVFFLSQILFAAPQSFVLQGQIVKPDGQTLEGSSVTFTLEVLSPGVEECLLYQEQQTINMVNSNGVFSLVVGEGTQSGSDYEDVNSLSDALNNSIGLITPTTCDSVGSYNPALTDGRKVRVTFDDGTGPITLSQDHLLQSVPYADSASSVDGLTASNILNVDTTGTNVLTQSNLVWVFETARYAELQALIGGTSSNYLNSTPTANFSMNTNKITDVATPTATGDAANKGYVDGSIGGNAASTGVLGAGDTGEVLVWNGSQWTAAAPAGDSTKLPLAGGTMTGAIAMGNQDINDIKDVDVNNDLSVGNNVAVTGSLSANGVSTSGTLAFYNGLNYVGFQAPAGASDLIWTLPGSDGTANQALSTNAAGVLSWRSYVESASNVGTAGVGSFKQNANGDLEFRNINAAADDKVTVTLDAANNEIDLSVDESNFNSGVIPNTAAGNVTALNVQAAINELDGDKVAKAGDSMSGALTMDAENEVRFADNDDSHYVGFKAPAAITAAASFVWELPVDDGSPGQLLSTDGSGALSWVTDSPSDNLGNHTATTDLNLNNNGITNLELGSAAAPSISFNSDADTGVYSPAADSVSLATAGTERLRVDASGNVGIGTTSPVTRLTLDSSVDSWSALTINNSAQPGLELLSNHVNSTAGWHLMNEGNVDRFSIRESGTATPVFSAENGAGANGGQIYIDASGDVGIGSATPAFKVHSVGKVAAPSLRFSQNYLTNVNPDWYGIELYGFDNGSGDELRLRGRTTATGAFSDLVTFKNSGELGIGTTAPAEKLDVEGRVLSGAAGTLTGETGSVLMEELAANESAPGVYEKTGFRAPDALAADIIYTLPGTAPGAGQILSSDASGNLTWIADDTGGAGDILDGGNTKGAAVTIGTNDNFDFNLESNSLTRMTIDAGGNIGVGTTTPVDVLHLEGSGAYGLAFTPLIDSSSMGLNRVTDGTDEYLSLYNMDTGSTNSNLRVYDHYFKLWGNGGSGANFTPGIAFSGGLVLDYNGADWLWLTRTTTAAGITTPGALPLHFRTNDTFAMGIDTSGNVGIGTTSPGSMLDVRGTTGISLNPNEMSGASRSWMTDGLRIGAGDNDGAYFGMKDEGSNNADTVVAWGDDVTDDLRFIHVLSGGPLEGHERMRMTALGDLGVGTTAPSERLDIEGRVLSGAAGTLTGETGSLLMEELAANESAPGVYEKTGFRAPDALAADIIYTLPGTAPGAGQILSSDASGNLTWIADDTGGAGDILDGGNTKGAAVTIGTNDNFDFSLESNSQTRMTIDAGGNIGIGTTSPSRDLEIQAKSGTSATLLLDTSDAATDGNLIFSKQGTERFMIGYDASPEGFRIYDNTAAQTRFFLDTSGNIGLGTTNPASALTISKASTQAGILQENTDGGAGGQYPSITQYSYNAGHGALVGGRAGGTKALPTAAAANVTLQTMVGQAHDGTSFNEVGRISVKSGDSFSGANLDGKIEFQVRNANVPNTAMVIQETGNVGIGSTTPTQKLDVGGTVKATAFVGDGSGLTGVSASSSSASSSQTNYVINTDSDNTGSDGGVAIQTNGSTVATITAAGNIQSASGAVATPGLSFTGDTNTGLFNPAADTLSVSAGGVEGLRVNTVASGVNYVELTPAATGSGPIIAAGGSDTNIDLNITPKGTGNTIFTNGNVGIGTTAPSNPFVIETVETDGGNGNNIDSMFETTITASTTDYNKSISGKLINYAIPAGVVDSGYKIGVEGSAYANSGLGFAGTLNMARGVWARSGVFDGAVGSVITNAYGVDADIISNDADSTITNAYGVHISNGAGTTPITNNFGLYQETAAAKNYFAGNVGIGTTAPVGKLDVFGGDIEVTGSNNALLRFRNAANDDHASLGLSSGGLALSGNSSFVTNEHILINNSGDVGIGTTSPSGQLDIEGGDVFIGTGTLTNTSVNEDLSVTGNIEADGTFYGDGSGLSGVVASSATTSSSQTNYVINTDSDNTGSDGGVAIQTNGSTVAIITAAGNIQSASGAVATPGLSFTGDTNTGLFNPAADTLSVSAGGVEGLRVNTVASGVNYVELTPAATGSGPIIAAGGSDTNIDLNMTPKGTGNTIFTNGNVGIGTTAPDRALSIVVDSKKPLGIESIGTTAAPSFAGFRARGSIGAKTAVNNGDNLAIMTGFGYGSTGYSASSVGALQFYAAENFTDASMGTHFNIATTPIGSITKVDRLTILENGNVGIGTTNPDEKLDVDGLVNLVRVSDNSTSRELKLGVLNDTENASNSFANGDVSIFMDSPVDDGQANTLRFYGKQSRTLDVEVYDGDFLVRAGDVGIGTATPSGLLDIEGGDVFIGTGTLTNTSVNEDLSVTGNIEADGTFYGDGSGLSGVVASSATASSSQTNYVINTDSDNAGSDGGVAIQTNGSTVATITAAGNIQSASGAVATPGLSFTGDTNTGLFNPAADTLSVSAGGVEGLRVNTVASGVNYVELTPAATGNGPIIAAGGSDTNIDLNITPKGTGDTIFTNGNVGIGTSNPSGVIHTLSSDAVRFDRAGSPSFGSHLLLRGSNGTVATPTASTLGDTLGTITFSGYDGSIFPTYGARISSVAQENWSATNGGNNLTFSTTPNGSLAPLERMRISNAGNVGIGTSSVRTGIEVMARKIRSTRSIGESNQYIDLYGGGAAGTYLTAMSRESNSKLLNIQSLHDETGAPAGNIGFRFQLGAASAPTDVLNIDSQGYVGIGSSNPVSKLDILESVNNSATTLFRNSSQLQVANSDNTAGSKSLIRTEVSLDGHQFGTVYNANDDVDFVIAKEVTSGNHTPLMTIDNAGNVGIGTTTPDKELQVKGQIEVYDEATWPMTVVTSYNADTFPSYFMGYGARGGDKSTPLFSQSGDTLAIFEGRSVGVAGPLTGAGMRVKATELHSSTAMGSELKFKTVPNGTKSAIDRLTITESGNVGIGTTTPDKTLTVMATGNQQIKMKTFDNTLPQYSSGFWGSRSRGATIGTDSHPLAGDRLTWFGGVSDNGGALGYGYMSVETTEAHTDTTKGISMTFHTTPNGQTSNVKVMTLDQSGYVGIGTTTPASKLHVDGAGAGGGVCVTSDGVCSAVPTGGQISAETTLNTGADYAEYFEAEEDMESGELVGLNPETGRVRKYQSGDNLIGIVSTNPGVVGNSELAGKSDTVLVALVGQVPFNDQQVSVKEGQLYTLDGTPLGYLLASGMAYINLASSQSFNNINRKVSSLEEKIAQQAQTIDHIRSQSQSKLQKKEQTINDLKSRLEKIEKFLKLEE